jgi:NADPH:quinone reductase-like Zn-dependent oxidoreductase
VAILFTMRALQFSAVNRFAVTEVPDPAPVAGEAVVALRAAALNHRDVWIKTGNYSSPLWPCIPGSDGAGKVIHCGDAVDNSWLGRDVIIDPCFDWGNREEAQDPGFSILGLPRSGTLAEKIAVPVKQLSAKPAHLTWEEAAALPLAGLTAYRAVFSRAKLRAGERVLISGIGGGVALFALQFAVTAGADAWVTSSSDDKIAKAVGLGARGGFNYTRDGWGTEAAKRPGHFAVVIDSAGGGGFEQLIEIAAPGARVVFFGATRGNPPVLPMRKVFWRQLSLLGTTMGSPADWDGMLDFVSREKLRPVVSAAFPLARAGEAFELMERGGQFGKIVVTLE